MPGLDKTGPMEQGSQTGRKQGNCNKNTTEELLQGRGMGRRFRFRLNSETEPEARGRGRGFGRGRKQNSNR